MSKDFERVVCSRFANVLSTRMFRRSAPCTYSRVFEATIGAVTFIEGTSSRVGFYVPRLSIALRNLGTEYAVTSRDLMQPGNQAGCSGWYKWTKEGSIEIDAVQEQLVTIGLPWLDEYADLEELGAFLQQNVVLKEDTEGETRRPWLLIGPRGGSLGPRVNTNNLMFLSYCREAQGRYRDALSAWEEYGRAVVLREGSEKKRSYEERHGALMARASDSG